MQWSTSDWRQSQQDWSLRGKMAVSDGQEGAQLSLTWVAQAGSNDIQVRTSLGGPRWQLSYGADFARFSGTKVEARTGSDVEALLFEATGWPLPIERLRYWLWGLAAPDDEVILRDQDGQPIFLQAEGWRVELSEYRPVSSGAEGWVMLPTELELHRPPYRIRVVMGRWDWLKNGSNG